MLRWVFLAMGERANCGDFVAKCRGYTSIAEWDYPYTCDWGEPHCCSRCRSDTYINFNAQFTHISDCNACDANNSRWWRRYASSLAAYVYAKTAYFYAYIHPKAADGDTHLYAKAADDDTDVYAYVYPHAN